MAPPVFTPFESRDTGAVIAVFRSNTPEFYDQDAEGALEANLVSPDGPHWVMRDHGRVVGYGGYEIGAVQNRVVLVWGMVHRDSHGRGLGRSLLEHRARHACDHAPASRWLVVDTTPEIAPFYERCGFEAVERWPEGYRAGLDMMVLRRTLHAPDGG